MFCHGWFWLPVLSILAGLPPASAALSVDGIPEPLRPWIDWVLDAAGPDGDRRACSWGTAAGEQVCAWPGPLRLELTAASGGSFAQSWQLLAPGWIPLPGDADLWPREVQADRAPVPVVPRAGRPAVWLAPGRHDVTGWLHWTAPPEALLLPATTGLLSLTLDGHPVPRPRLESTGRLWLGEGGPGAAGPRAGDYLTLNVQRRIEDSLPLQVTTRIELEVAGRARLLQLDPVILADGIPLALASPLPARLDPAGRLEVQIRPGHWVLEIAAHHPGAIDALTAPERAAPWPDHEVWVFAARPELRRVTLDGAVTLDPRQTRLPPAWLELPAYRLAAGTTLILHEQARGDPDPGPDRLRLLRTLWLDPDGFGYSARDRIEGQLTRSWRLETGPELALGQVTVDGAPRLVTRLAAAGGAGVEVRRGALSLVADSRLPATGGVLPAAGWTLPFESAQTRLNLPPGWDVLAAAGVDNRPETWFARWSLLDLFLVLLLALGTGRLRGWYWGLLALAALALTWQAPGAPQLVWLHLLAGAALLRLIPAAPARGGVARLRLAALTYFRLSLLALLLIGLPFLVGQVRQGLYPHLDQPTTAMANLGLDAAPRAVPAPQFDAFSEPEALLRDEAAASGGSVSKRYARPAAPPPPAPAALDPMDPEARIQTGPGIPDWQWRAIDLVWTGAVDAGDGARLWLLSPVWSLTLALLGGLLLVVLGWRIADPRGAAGAASGTLALLLAISAGLPAGPAQAGDWPDPALLDSLRERLLRPPDCLPDCVALSHLALQAESDRLHLSLTLDAAAAVAAPIPGGAGAWRPTRVLADGEPADGIQRTADDQLRIPLEPGRHRVELSGPLPAQAQIEIPLPLAPHALDATVNGWTLEGLDERGRPGGQLQLLRQEGAGAAESAALIQEALPPLLEVTRTLRLGLDWQIETQVQRRSPPQFPAALPVALLTGEMVQTPGVRVESGRVPVSLAPGETRTGWQSRLEPVAELTLTASTDPRLTEIWRLDLGPNWHLDRQDLTPVHHLGESGRWLPQWQPRPGERLTLAISRPPAVPGATLTIDRVDWEVTPGPRGSMSELRLRLRSSLGGVHRLRLPAGAVPVALRLDGRELPLSAQGTGIEVPLTPGPATIETLWRDPAAPLTLRYRPRGPDLGSGAVNLNLALRLPEDRWVLLAWGPPWGPAVLFWGVLLVLTVLAAGLAHTRLTPLRFHDWLLLGIGLSLSESWAALLVAGWLFALGLRRRLDAETPRWRFNLTQLGLILLTVLALSALLGAVQRGLLGMPEMQIQGQGSSASQLNWYQARGGPELPEIGLISVPLWVYRALMLAWALWLALRLLSWLRWGWEGFSRPLLWREIAWAQWTGTGIERAPRINSPDRTPAPPGSDHGGSDNRSAVPDPPR